MFNKSVPALESEETGDFWKYVFWITCVISVGGSVYVMLVSTFLNVYGPGLALRGKAGSMIRVCDGMIQERNTLLIAYIVSLLAFQVSNLGCFFIVMYSSGAIISTIILVISTTYGYICCQRIYGRFKVEIIIFIYLFIIIDIFCLSNSCHVIGY